MDLGEFRTSCDPAGVRGEPGPRWKNQVSSHRRKTITFQLVQQCYRGDNVSFNRKWLLESVFRFVLSKTHSKLRGFNSCVWILIYGSVLILLSAAHVFIVWVQLELVAAKTPLAAETLGVFNHAAYVRPAAMDAHTHTRTQSWAADGRLCVCVCVLEQQ